MAVSPIHTDDHYAEQHMDGGRSLVVGTYIYALLLGMSVPDTSGKAIAALGTRELKHVARCTPATRCTPTRRWSRRGRRRPAPTPASSPCGLSAGTRTSVTVCEFERTFLTPRRHDRADPGRDEFAGRVCIVTGAARGIGAAIAENLAPPRRHRGRGDIRLDGAQERAGILTEKGLRAEAMRVDVSDADDVARLVDEVGERCGTPNVLVNNAGIVTVAPSDELPVEEWRRQVDVMLSGTFLMTQAVARPMLREGRGAIVNLSSIGGFAGHPGRSAYNAAKAGISCLTQVLGVEWAARGIRVNAVAPAVTRTEMLEHVLRTLEGATKRGEYAARTPMGRVAEPEEIAECVAFLASDRARFVTGTTLLIDGGWMLGAGLAEGAGSELLRRHRRHRRLRRPSSRPSCGRRCCASRWAPSTAWIHLVAGRRRRAAEPVGRRRRRGRRLPRGEGGAFIAVVPAFGVIEPPHEEPAELAAGAARAFARARIERWSEEGRRINIVAYGALDTNAIPGLRSRDVLAARTPMHRLASVSELADAIDFLASSSASYVTGSVLDLDGGWAAYSWFYPARDL